MLRIAVPNKGSLSETAAEMLLEAGYLGRRDPRDQPSAEQSSATATAHSTATHRSVGGAF